MKTQHTPTLDEALEFESASGERCRAFFYAHIPYRPRSVEVLQRTFDGWKWNESFSETLRSQACRRRETQLALIGAAALAKAGEA